MHIVWFQKMLIQSRKLTQENNERKKVLQEQIKTKWVLWIGSAIELASQRIEFLSVGALSNLNYL